MKAVSIKISGKVQGVFFRKSTQEKAIELGIAGFVQNMPNGSVYAEAEGDDDAMNSFIEWCKQGPASAMVTGIEITPAITKGYHEFIVKK